MTIKDGLPAFVDELDVADARELWNACSGCSLPGVGPRYGGHAAQHE
jgi:hypothetical protein